MKDEEQVGRKEKTIKDLRKNMTEREDGDGERKSWTEG